MKIHTAEEIATLEHGFAHPWVTWELIQLPSFVDTDDYPKNVELLPGEIGYIGTVRIQETGWPPMKPDVVNGKIKYIEAL